MKKIIIGTIVVVVVAAAFWLVFKKPGSPILPFGQKVEEQSTPVSGLGGQLFDQVQQNPAEKLPETNPFDKDLNPYKEAYTNPFE